MNKSEMSELVLKYLEKRMEEVMRVENEILSRGMSGDASEEERGEFEDLIMSSHRGWIS